MNFSSTFAITYGACLACQAMMAGFIFRTSSAPRLLKYVLPTIAVVTASVAPFAVNSMMGYPTTSAVSDLPERMRVIEFVPHDDTHTVDIWSVTNGDVPRAYEVNLTESLKKTLSKAREKIDRGEPTYIRIKLAKKKGKEKERETDTDSVDLDDSVRSTLPSKDP